ncbi:MAG TPA: GNAT family N-acetyltransferase [Acidimicrobiales bacterium]|nr:GNAT family N-acetyltransferase [Acidimicrobiales bacterium]
MTVDSTTSAIETAIETVFRIEFPRLVAGLARRVDDVSLAEDLAQEALADAMVAWPRDGVPRNPGAWLMAVGKRKAIDRFRRDRTLASKYRQLAPLARDAEIDVDLDRDGIEDDRLRMMFVACHPVLPIAARTALTLRLVGGLSTAEIGRAYLQPESTVAQRIVRAKKAIAAAGVPFEVPVGEERARRLGSVLEVIYVIFTEGYTATTGPEWTRPDLCHEALRLGRQLARLSPDESEVHGLVSLMELQSSRLAARVGPSGEIVLLADQDRGRWDQLHIRLGLVALARAEKLRPELGPYGLQAAIAACHSRASSVGATDWPQVVALYERLAACTRPSPIIELNRAVAVSMASGPADALKIVDDIASSGSLDRYHLLHSVRGDLLAKLGRHDDASVEFEHAAALATNDAERSFSASRVQTCTALAATPVLTDGRVLLRMLSLADAPAWLAGEDEEQLRWFQMPAATLADVERAIRRWQAGWMEGGLHHWGIWIDGALVGGVELSVRDDRRANVSYAVFAASRGRGVASAAVGLAAAWGRQNLPIDAVVAIIDEANLASRGVAERTGFALDGPAAPWEHAESGVMLRYVRS